MAEPPLLPPLQPSSVARSVLPPPLGDTGHPGARQTEYFPLPPGPEPLFSPSSAPIFEREMVHIVMAVQQQ